MDKRTAIELISGHRAELKKRGVTALYLFGSVARGDQSGDSDTDVSFEYEEGMAFSAFDLIEVQDYLKTLLGESTDVVPKNSLHRRIRPQALVDTVQVF